MFEDSRTVRYCLAFRLDLLGLRLSLPLQRRPAQIYDGMQDSIDPPFRLKYSDRFFEAHEQDFKVNVRG